MQAAVCATSLTSGIRSRRAISESCSDAGMVVSPVSRIALVSSSTNSGTPSVRAMIASITAAGSGSPLDPRHDRRGPGAPQAVEGQTGDVGMGGKLGLLIGAAGEQDQHARVGDPIEALLHHLEGGGVDPVRILDHHEHRLLPCERQQLLDQRLERPRPLGLWCQVERAVARLALEPDQARRSGARRGRHPPARASSASSLSSLRVARIVGRDARPRGSVAGSPARARCRRDRASTGSGCGVRLARRAHRAAPR